MQLHGHLIKENGNKVCSNISYHSAITSIDNLQELITSYGAGFQLEKMKLHRRKCASLIKNVILPALYDDLWNDMEGEKYCVMIDESTDVSCIKCLCLSVRYYNKKEQNIVTLPLGLIPVTHATGEAMKGSFEDSKLNLTDCIGFASAGASTIVGEHDSVWCRMKIAATNCIMMKCICHSLAFCVMHAFEKIPSHLWLLISKIPKWFSKSILRCEAYSNLFDIIDENRERRGKVRFNILLNWHELNSYFSIAGLEGTAQVRIKGLISDMLKDHINMLYFHFIRPLIGEFEK